VFSAQFIEHFHFLRPAWALTLLPIVFIAWQQRRRSDETRGWEAIIAPHLLEALRLRQFRNRWFNPSSLGAALMVLMVIILMGPTWRQQPSPLSRDEAALVVVLDVSPSMRQRDVQPSRLERAKQKISDLLTQRSGSRAALVVYSGSAHTVLTLTDDAEILNQYLKAVGPRVMPREGKFAEYSLAQVDRIVGEQAVPVTVLLLSDGVSPATESAFGEYFSRNPYQLIVWGMGSDAPDEPGIAPLETDALKSLASAAGGDYLALAVDKSDVDAIDRRIDAHYIVSPDSGVPWLDAGYWLVFPTLAIFALWFRRGWTLQWCLALMLAGGLMQPQQAQADASWFVDLWLTEDQQGRWHFERGQYHSAAEAFRDPMWKGLAWYYAEEFRLAAEYFSRIDTQTARFNRANALAHAMDYVPAVRVYTAVMENSVPGSGLYQAAASNRAIVQEIIDAINRMSASQADEGLGTRELGEDDPQRAEGAERRMAADQEVQQLDAEQVLQDEKINEMWMRSVQRDPANFLGVKFSMQLDEAR
jgi:Ca-activated chloride channel family protein